MINVNSYKLIIVVYMSHYLVLLILEFLPAQLATLPYGLDSNVTQLLANMLTKPSVFYYLPIVPCNLVSIKLLLLLLLFYIKYGGFLNENIIDAIFHYTHLYYKKFRRTNKI